MYYLTGIIITFFLSVLLITKKNKSKPDLILAIWLVVIGTHLALFYLYTSGRYAEFPFYLGFERPMPLLHGPFLFLYTAFSTQQNHKYPLLHFLPLAAYYILITPFLLLPASERLYVYQHHGEGYEGANQILNWAILISGVTYVTLSWRLLERHKQNIKQQFSSTVRINLAWLQYLIYGLGIIWLLVIYGDDFYIFGAVVLFVFFLGYFGIKQVGIFSHVHALGQNDAVIAETPKTEEASAETLEAKKYQKSGLNSEMAMEIHRNLNKTMETEMLYKNPELTLPELSEKLDVHPNILSQVINTQEQKNFYDYINSLRIEDFKKKARLPENQKYSLLGLALQSGFNSKTSFNRNFKKATGLSPSDFLRQNNIQLQ